MDTNVKVTVEPADVGIHVTMVSYG